MREYVGTCRDCSAKVYCHDGFIGGMVLDDGMLVCFDCFEKRKEKSKTPDS
jgi:hypothetical protein